MDQETTQLASAQAAENPVEAGLVSTAEAKHRQFSKTRFAEEREWYEAALFYQRRQWLSWNSTSKRWQLIKKDTNKPKPMPVTNHFAKTINANANQLGAKPPAMVAVPHDDSDEKRRAADSSEAAIKAIDKETNFRVLNPLLAKHTVLWGTGVTKDFIDTSISTGSSQVPQVETAAELMVSCPDCMGSYDLGPASAGIPVDQLQIPCPQCGSQSTIPFVKQIPTVSTVTRVSRGKLCTEVRPIFEVYIPRDCQDPNLAKEIVHKYRKPLGEAKRIWGDKAQDLRADEKSDIHEIYLEALRSLVNYNYMHDQQGEVVTILEYWADYDQLPTKLQEKLEEQLQGTDPGLLEQCMSNGIFVITGGGKCLQWGPIPLGRNKKPFTFFCWEKDPASPYCKGLSTDLVPIQKRLNRLDSLIELAVQVNAVGKWLWPSTQTKPKPSGSPNEVVEYDTIGDGKNKPEFVLPHPFSPMVWQLRATILQDFQELGMTNAVQQGSVPGGGQMPFRGLAYLGAKASEQLNTARSLWEMAHQMRYEKTILLARACWDEGRQVRIAGFNGRFGMRMLMGSDLADGVDLEFVPDSSRPSTLEEKFELFGTLLEGGLVDPTDPATRDFVMDLANLEGLNLVDHLQHEKAARNLDRLKQGMPPLVNQFMKFDVHLRYMANFIQTEEFEDLPPQIQNVILSYAQMLDMQMAMITGGMGMPQPNQQAAQLAGAIKNRGGGTPSPLSQVPGDSGGAESSQSAAEKQAAVLGNHLP